MDEGMSQSPGNCLACGQRRPRGAARIVFFLLLQAVFALPQRHTPSLPRVPQNQEREAVRSFRNGALLTTALPSDLVPTRASHSPQSQSASVLPTSLSSPRSDFTLLHRLHRSRMRIQRNTHQYWFEREVLHVCAPSYTALEASGACSAARLLHRGHAHRYQA